MGRFLFIAFILLTASAGSVWAAGGGGGGGGGGGTPSCSSDTWSCGDWSACSLTGEQTRTCTLTNDCSFVTDPSPSTTQSCTPSCTSDTWECGAWTACPTTGQQTRSCTKSFDCPLTDTPSPVAEQTCTPECTADTWDCGEFSACDALGKQTRTCTLSFDCLSAQTPKPKETQTCTPSCRQDTWKCGNWEACDKFGNQTRSCSRTNDCPGVDTPTPPASQRCDHLQCVQSKLYDRVLCRLNLDQAGRERELEIRYLPEACRAFTGDEQTECIAYYKAYNACWKNTPGPARANCAKQTLKLGDVAEEKKKCGATPDCLEELQDKVHDLIIFRFYDLEQRAEDTMAQGVDRATVAKFVTKVVENKIVFMKAMNKTARRNLIQKMRDDWKAFKQEAGL